MSRARAPRELVRRLLGCVPETIEPMVVWDHRATFRVRIGDERFVCKFDSDKDEHRREVVGNQRAAAAGVPVPEIIALEPGAFAMRWVDGVALATSSPECAWRAAGAVVRSIHSIPVTEPEFGGGFVGRAATWTDALLAAVDDTIEPAAATCARTAISAAQLDHITGGWCHGDLQPEHIVLDPDTHRIRAVLDWSDQGRGDPAWDVAVLTLDDDRALPAFVRGYGGTVPDDRLGLYRVVRLFSEVRWLAEHGFAPAADAAVARLRAWGASTSRPPRRDLGGNRS